MRFVNSKNLSEYIAEENMLSCWGGKDDYVYRFEPGKLVQNEQNGFITTTDENDNTTITKSGKTVCISPKLQSIPTYQPQTLLHFHFHKSDFDSHSHIWLMFYPRASIQSNQIPVYAENVRKKSIFIRGQNTFLRFLYNLKSEFHLMPNTCFFSAIFERPSKLFP